jgi:hypothetical protein
MVGVSYTRSIPPGREISMIKTEDLKQNISDYLDECSIHSRKPSYFTFGHFIAVSPTTIRHVCTGQYADGKPYTDTPHIKRVIDNQDFKLVRELFENPE